MANLSEIFSGFLQDLKYGHNHFWLIHSNSLFTNNSITVLNKEYQKKHARLQVNVP